MENLEHKTREKIVIAPENKVLRLLLIVSEFIKDVIKHPFSDTKLIIKTREEK